MRSTFKVLFYVNGSKEKNGIVPIMGRVTINGSVAQFSCKQSIHKDLWDVKGNRAKGKSKEARELNLALDNIKAQIIKYYQRISDREAFVTAEMVRNAYQGIGTEYETLLRAFDKENEAFAKRVGKDRSLRTYQKYLTVRKYLAEFIKVHYKRTDIAMNELTEDFIRDYCLYLRNEVGLAQSSVWIYSIPLKHIVTTAHYNVKAIVNKSQSSGDVLNSLAEIKAKQQEESDKVKKMFRETNENIESGIANAKHLRISIDEPHVLITFVIMSAAIAVLSVALHLAKRPNYERIDNDLKYRYIKMKGDASAEHIATLEDIFELNRDNQKIEQMREDVEIYEEAVRKQAALTEQARLKEQAAKEQESRAKSIKNKQDDSKVNLNNKSKP